MKTMTEDECDLIDYAARRIIGNETWDTLCGTAEVKISTIYDRWRPDCDDDDSQLRTLRTLLALLRGERFDLRRPWPMDVGRTVLREATVQETVDEMFRRSHMYVEDIIGPVEVDC